MPHIFHLNEFYTVRIANSYDKVCNVECMYITHTQIERVDIKDAGLKKGIMEMGCSAIASQGMCTSRVILYIVSVMENVASRWSWKTSIVYIYI